LLVLTYRGPDPERNKAWAEEIDRRVDTEHLCQYKSP
jgi:hypothetical protein